MSEFEVYYLAVGPLFFLRSKALLDAFLKSGICLSRWNQILRAFSATSASAITAAVNKWWSSPAGQSAYRAAQSTINVEIERGGNFGIGFGSGVLWRVSNVTYTVGGQIVNLGRVGDQWGYNTREAAVLVGRNAANSGIQSALKAAQKAIEEAAAWQKFQSITPASILGFFPSRSNGKTSTSGSQVNVHVEMSLEFKAKKTCRGCSGAARAVGLSNILDPVQAAAAASSARCSWVKDGKPKITYQLKVDEDPAICSQLMASIRSFVQGLDPAAIARRLTVSPPPEQIADNKFNDFIIGLNAPTCNGPSSAEGSLSTPLRVGTVKVAWNSFPTPN
jgi:hypothetical protein